MTRKPSTMTCVGALVAGLTVPVLGAQANQTDEQNLEQEVAQLRAEIAEMRQSDEQMSERRAEEVKTLVHDVLSDAETRSSMLQGGLNAGHDGDNFYIGSTDDRFRLNVGGQVQLRYLVNVQDDTTAPGSDSEVWGFEIPRASLKFWGHIANPRLEYSLQMMADERAANVDDIFLQEALISYELLDGIKVWGGQTKAPFQREDLVDSSQQLAVERSLQNQIFSIGLVQGVGVKTEVQDMVRVNASLNNGIRSGEPLHRNASPVAKPNGSNTKGFMTANTDFALTGRADVKVAGDWEQADDFTAWQGDPMGIFVGAAGHFEKGQTGDTGVANDDFWAWTVDASAQNLGWSVYGALNHLRTDRAAGNDAELWGLMAQGSYNIDDTFEPFARYEYLDLSNSSTNIGFASQPADAYINLVTAGVNWYHNQHNAKFTADVVWAMDTIPNAAALNTTSSDLGLLGLRPDQGTNEDQVAVRFQYQLLF